MNTFVGIAAEDITQGDPLAVDDHGKLRKAATGEAYFCHAPSTAKKGERIRARMCERVGYVAE